MDRLRPLAGGGLLVFLGVDELLARHAQLAQRHARQIDELKLLFKLDSRGIRCRLSIQPISLP